MATFNKWGTPAVFLAPRGSVTALPPASRSAYSDAIIKVLWGSVPHVGRTTTGPTVSPAAPPPATAARSLLMGPLFVVFSGVTLCMSGFLLSSPYIGMGAGNTMSYLTATFRCSLNAPLSIAVGALQSGFECLFGLFGIPHFVAVSWLPFRIFMLDVVGWLPFQDYQWRTDRYVFPWTLRTLLCPLDYWCCPRPRREGGGSELGPL